MARVIHVINEAPAGVEMLQVGCRYMVKGTAMHKLHLKTMQYTQSLPEDLLSV